MALLNRLRTGFRRLKPYLWGFTKWVLIPAAIAAAIVFSGGIAAIPIGIVLAKFALSTAVISIIGNGICKLFSSCLNFFRRRRNAPAPTQEEDNFSNDAEDNEEDAKPAPRTSPILADVKHELKVPLRDEKRLSTSTLDISTAVNVDISNEIKSFSNDFIHVAKIISGYAYPSKEHLPEKIKTYECKTIPAAIISLVKANEAAFLILALRELDSKINNDDLLLEALDTGAKLDRFAVCQIIWPFIEDKHQAAHRIMNNIFRREVFGDTEISKHRSELLNWILTEYPSSRELITPQHKVQLERMKKQNPAIKYDWLDDAISDITLQPPSSLRLG